MYTIHIKLEGDQFKSTPKYIKIAFKYTTFQYTATESKLFFLFEIVWIFEIIAETFSNGCKVAIILHSMKERKCLVNYMYLETNHRV